MARYAELRDRELEAPPELKVDREAAEEILGRHEGQRRLPARRRTPSRCWRPTAIPAPKVRAVTRAEDLEAAAAEVGFPCVLKVDSADVIHKSDEGGVVLGIDE